ncbi:Aste57867_2275 [Aphanomyces stellatus]|uniref:Aste57867_2275 protein n=1 Tax=Aphanomyces stellatus TaxID=120398 RepID=A0A485K8P3_9STRA|nr:hypothetical protein As57867_002270 [Aphanomyces stellatus]VFT79478.1 Aste57867_2275 [Aphanomyces stellatus]
MARPIESMPQWQLYAYAGLFLVLSVLLSNAIAWVKQFRQEARILAKTTSLTQAAAAPSGKIIPVTILTGFLGSGKTTLLNSILSSPDHGYKIMVLENELGAVSIDHELITTQHPRDGVVVLQNGCMCCSAASATSNELERILDHLLQVSAASTYDFDYLIVETTGIADPGPILKTFLELRASRFRLDGVVTLVDTASLLKTLTSAWPVEMHSQLAYADLIALNKMDLVDADAHAVDGLTQRIRDINPDARLVQCERSQLPVQDLLNIGTFDARRFDFTHVVSHHTPNLDTVLLETDAPLDLGRFSHWLNDVVDGHWKRGIFRLKGLVRADDDRLWVLQCVLDTYTLAPAAGESNSAKTTKLVVIGIHLDKAALDASFAAVAMTPKDKES